MSFRLPDQFHSAGIFLVRCGRHLKVGYATQRKKVTVQVSPLRVPVGVAGRGPATLVGAFLTECPAPKGLAESVCRTAAEFGAGPVAGDWYELDDAALDALVARFEEATPDAVPFERAGIAIPIRETDWTPEQSVSEAIVERRLDQHQYAHAAAEQRDAYSLHTKSGRRAALRARKARRRGEALPDRAPGLRAVPAPSQSEAPEDAPFKLHRLKRAPKRTATPRQYGYLLDLGASFKIERADFLQYVDRGDASDAIDAAKAGRPVVVERALPEVHADVVVSGEALRRQREIEADLAENRAVRKEASRRGSGSANGRRRETRARQTFQKGRPGTKSRTYYTGRPLATGRATAKQFNYLVALGATVSVDRETFTTHLSKRDATSAIDTQKAGVRHVTVECGYTPDARVGALTKADSRELIAQTL